MGAYPYNWTIVAYCKYFVADLYIGKYYGYGRTQQYDDVYDDVVVECLGAWLDVFYHCVHFETQKRLGVVWIYIVAAWFGVCGVGNGGRAGLHVERCLFNIESVFLNFITKLAFTSS